MLRTMVAGWPLLLAVALSGCPDSPPPTNTATPAEVSAVARGKVDVAHGLLDIAPAVDGIVSRIEVNTGDSVKKDQVLGTLDAQGAMIQAATARARLQQAQAQLTAQMARLPAQQALVARWRAAAKAGAAEQQKADDEQETLRQLQNDTAVARAAVALAKQEVAAAEYNASHYTLRAPQDGEIIRVAAQPGSRVTAGKALFVLLPAQPLLIRAEVNEHFIDRIRVGMTAQVFSESSPQGPAYTARVTRVGRVFETARLGDDASERSNRVVECILTLEPASSGQRKLRLGQNLLVKFQ